MKDGREMAISTTGMPAAAAADAVTPTLTGAAGQLYQEKARFLSTRQIARMVWERMLSEADRQSLGGDMEKALTASRSGAARGRPGLGRTRPGTRHSRVGGDCVEPHVDTLTSG
jgi:hypothetical protein